jgi:hypothetical protein
LTPARDYAWPLLQGTAAATLAWVIAKYKAAVAAILVVVIASPKAGVQRLIDAFVRVAWPWSSASSPSHPNLLVWYAGRPQRRSAASPTGCE